MKERISASGNHDPAYPLQLTKPPVQGMNVFDRHPVPGRPARKEKDMYLLILVPTNRDEEWTVRPVSSQKAHEEFQSALFNLIKEAWPSVPDEEVRRAVDEEVRITPEEVAALSFGKGISASSPAGYLRLERVKVDCMEVPTSAGTIKAYPSPDPGQPGICVMLQPAGYKPEIDCAFVSVYEDEEYQTSDKERPVDVCIHTYGDARTEDYTSKDILRREDVVKSLEEGGWSA